MSLSESQVAQIELAKKRMNADSLVKEGVRLFLEQEISRACEKACEVDADHEVRRYQGEVRALKRVLKALLETKSHA